MKLLQQTSLSVLALAAASNVFAQTTELKLRPNPLGPAQTGNVNITGTHQAGSFSGNGSLLTFLTGAAFTTGTVDVARLDTSVVRTDLGQIFTSANAFTNPANTFAGSGLTLLNLNASAVASGILPDSRLASGIARLSDAQTFTGQKTFNNPLNSFSGNGNGLTNIQWANLTGTPTGALRDQSQLWTGIQRFTNPANVFVGDGFNLTGMSTSSVAGAFPLLTSQNDWDAEHTFENLANIFVGQGASLTSLSGEAFSQGTLGTSFMSTTVALLDRNQTFANPQAFSGSTSLLGNVAVGAGAGSGVLLRVDQGNGPSMSLANAASGHIGMDIDGTVLKTYTNQATGKFSFGGSGVANGFAVAEATQTRFAGRVVTASATFTNGAAADTVMLGSANGNGVWGKAGSQHLASDSFSFEKVTGGLFRQFGYSLESPDGYPISLNKSSGTTVTLDPDSLIVEGYNLNWNVFANVINNNYGSLSIHDASGTRQGHMYSYPHPVQNYDIAAINVSGSKNFIEPDPDDPTMDLVYACIEGPEAAMYDRGTGRLVNGEAVITLPAHFQKLANLDTMTILLTPNGESRGLYAKKKGGTFVVRELRGGKSNIVFDWEVKCVRAEFEEYEVMRRWDANQPAEVDRAEAWQARLASIQERLDRSRASQLP